MTSFIVPVIIVYMFIGLIFILVGFLIFLLVQFRNIKKLDKVIIIDEANRYKIVNKRLMTEKTKINDKTYFLKSDGALLNKKGKKLFIFSYNKPAPMKIGYNKTEWMSSDSLMGSINNELIKMMVRPTNAGKDMVILLGAIGGILAGVASVLILMRTFGVF